MRSRATALLLSLVVLAGATACGNDDEVTADDLDGRSFVASSVEGQDLVPEVDVRFAFADAFLNIDGGCNSINGGYEVNDGTLTWTDEPFGTLIGCEPALQAQDEWLTALVTDGAVATLDDSTLTLEGDGTTLELDEVEDGTAGGTPLEGTTWQLTGIGDGPSLTERPDGVEAPTLQIDDDQAVVFTGCNNGSAGVEVGEGTLTFEPLVLTRIACEGESADVEAAQTAMLDGEVDYVLEGTTLILRKGDQGLVYQTG
jgi:heat shock protein HslJ